jgi:hypothetical protein
MKSVVITGAASGIGHATARLALKKGVRVFGAVRRQDQADRLTEEFGSGFTPLLFDVRDEAAIRMEAVRVRHALEGATLGGLVHCAVRAVPGPLLHQPLEEIRDQLETDLLGPMLVSKVFAPLLGADPDLAGPPGRIVTLSSIGGKLGQPFACAYIAAKHGLEGFSDALRRELLPFGIDVIIVAPGVVNTPVWSRIEAQDRSRYRDTVYAEPLEEGVATMVKAGREAGLTAEEAAKTVMTALTAKRPKLRYAPSKHPVLEQGVLRVAPRRLIDRAMGAKLGLKRGETRGSGD